MQRIFFTILGYKVAIIWNLTNATSQYATFDAILYLSCMFDWNCFCHVVVFKWIFNHIKINNINDIQHVYEFKPLKLFVAHGETMGFQISILVENAIKHNSKTVEVLFVSLRIDIIHRYNVHTYKLTLEAVICESLDCAYSRGIYYFAHHLPFLGCCSEWLA